MTRVPQVTYDLDTSRAEHSSRLMAWDAVRIQSHPSPPKSPNADRPNIATSMHTAKNLRHFCAYDNSASARGTVSTLTACLQQTQNPEGGNTLQELPGGDRPLKTAAQPNTSLTQQLHFLVFLEPGTGLPD